ncbi:hypothetical protein TWF281_003207 [Arthrobotrys megalospora]
MYVSETQPIPTLFELAKRVCIRHVNGIDDVGDLPYSVIRPVLLRVESPDKLRGIEENSPHLTTDTAELWHTFIRRDIGRTVLDDYLPPNQPESVAQTTNWSKLYFKLRKQKLAREKAQIEELKAEMKKCYDKKEKRQIGFANVRREDVGKLRMLDKCMSSSGRDFSGVLSGRVNKDGTPRVFRNSMLNKVLVKGHRNGGRR